MSIEYYIHGDAVIVEDGGNFRYADSTLPTLPTLHTTHTDYFPTTVLTETHDGFDATPPPIFVHSDRSLTDVSPIVVASNTDYMNVDRIIDSVIPIERAPPSYSYHTSSSGAVYAFENPVAKRGTTSGATAVSRSARAYHASPRMTTTSSPSTSAAPSKHLSTHTTQHGGHGHTTAHSMRGLTPSHISHSHGLSSHSVHGGHGLSSHATARGHGSSHSSSHASHGQTVSSRHHHSAHLSAAVVGATQVHVSSAATSPHTTTTTHALRSHGMSAEALGYTPTSLPAIPESDVQRLEYIGCGTNASVFTCLFDGAMACEKVLTSDDRDAQLQEAFMMAAVDRHPNVLRLYGLCRRSNGETSLVLELMQNDLLQKLQEYKHTPGFSPSRFVVQLIEFLIQAARGLRYLHRQGVVHRDVACRNMLISGNCLKLADFGLAKQRSSNRFTSDLPKPLSTAPEAIRDLDNPKVWSEKSDIWSYGLFMWEVLSFGEDPLAEFHNSVPALLSALNMGWKPVPIEHCPDVVWGLLLQCLSLSPEKRPSFDQILTNLTNAQMEHANSGGRHGSGGDPDIVVVGYR